ncbi:type II toxin-antitoxin system RelE/ParE family toxin [Dyadobacter sp. CY356]|uniref:type II toxin-antitoxin system RelE/ParE family toxin n=1 Tax=Dyadobacter sp. CY356 TaxID=2906442 RepID=UPI001F34F2FE|nr:type II toxin-antitoxin system RelE/ParE family toxin [Dyadobacter sp. CY356]MCF0056730.1 type II toxin-antitoxin system RelE/ParE family toxin [Dyadobacter sp. CY356]
MALNIIWSPKALNNFHDILDYLEENWNDAVIRDFVYKTESIIQQVSEYPKSFRQVSLNNSVREGVITKHNLLLYRIQKDQIFLLAFFDTRQHPKKKKGD